MSLPVKKTTPQAAGQKRGPPASAAHESGAAKKARHGAAMVNQAAIKAFVEENFDRDVVPKLCEFVAIPNQSPDFDPNIHTNGLQEKAFQLVYDWVAGLAVPDMTCEVIHDAGKTPILFCVAEGSDKTEETVFLYGHIDKQPPMTDKWSEGLGPHKPVIRDGKLYGRGGADDGYSAFAAITAIRALKAQGAKHPRCVILVEGCEESGSEDLPHYMQKLSARIGTPSLVVCLDSGCGNYDTVWLTTSLRGCAIAKLDVAVTAQAVHSGDASGVIPSTFRIARILLDRLEDAKTGDVLVPECHCPIPDSVREAAVATGKTLGKALTYEHQPFLKGVQPMSQDLTELTLARTWKPTISYTGQDGIPSVEAGGNVLRTSTTLKLSIRLPPNVDAKKAQAAVVATLTRDPPYNAKVTVDMPNAMAGWMAPELPAFLQQTLTAASSFYTGNDFRMMGEGGSIPFMTMLGEMYPEAKFVVTGVLGPNSNAHGPDEFMEIGMAKAVTCTVADVLASVFQQVSAK